MENQNDGKLSPGLLKASKRPVLAHFTITLVNHEDMRKSLTRGTSSGFTGWTVRQVASMVIGALGHFGWFQERLNVDLFIDVSDTKDPSFGYLEDDFFTLKLELRRRCLENESFTYKVRREKVLCEVSPQTERF